MLIDHTCQFLFHVVGLYDTGADICCVEQQDHDKILKHLKPRLLNTKTGVFKAANGGLLQTNGRYLLTLQINMLPLMLLAMVN